MLFLQGRATRERRTRRCKRRRRRCKRRRRTIKRRRRTGLDCGGLSYSLSNQFDAGTVYCSKGVNETQIRSY